MTRARGIDVTRVLGTVLRMPTTQAHGIAAHGPYARGLRCDSARRQDTGRPHDDGATRR